MRDDMKDFGEDDDGRPLPEEWLDAAKGWHRPPETPRDAMWAGIEAKLPDAGIVSLAGARAARRVDGGRGWMPAAWIRTAAAAAAVLALGVGIGRWTAPVGEPGPVEVAEGEPAAVDAPAGSPAVRLAAMQHLGRSESLLTMLRADARSGRVDAQVGEWSRGLLAETRLLLDSPVSQDPALRDLLQDLELILAQVAVLDGGAGGVQEERRRAELEIIARGLDEQDVLSRIQAVMPAGPGAGMTGI